MKRDKKTRTTRKMLAQSLKNLMNTKPFSKITVNEIVKDCELNRNTFYYHFEDTNALLKWILEEEAIKIVKQFDLIQNHRDALLFMFQYIEDNSSIINCALDSLGREALKHFFHDDFFAIMQKVVDDTETMLNSHLDKDYKNFITEFYTNALAEMLVDYLHNKDRKNQEILIRYYVSTTRSSLKGIMTDYMLNGTTVT